MNSVLLSIAIFLKTIVSPISLDVKVDPSVDQVKVAENTNYVNSEAIITPTAKPEPKSTPSPQPNVKTERGENNKKTSSSLKETTSKSKAENKLDAINKNVKKFLDVKD